MSKQIDMIPCVIGILYGDKYKFLGGKKVLPHPQKAGVAS